MPNAQTSHRLSDAQIQSYWEDGFLCPIPAISAQQCEDWRAQLEAIEGDWLDNDPTTDFECIQTGQCTYRYAAGP